MTTNEMRIAELERVATAQAAAIAGMQRTSRYVRRGLAGLAVLLVAAGWGAVRSGAQTTPTGAPEGTPAVAPEATPAPPSTEAAGKVVQASRFEVVDGAGRVLAVLGAEGDTGVLRVQNGKGKTLVLLGPHRNGSGDGTVTTFNRDGDVLVHVASTGDKAGSISTFDAAGQELIHLGASNQGAGSILNFNRNGQKMALVTGMPEGGLLAVFNEAGNSVAKIGVRDQGSGIIEVYGANGAIRSLDPLGDAAENR